MLTVGEFKVVFIHQRKFIKADPFIQMLIVSYSALEHHTDTVSIGKHIITRLRISDDIDWLAEKEEVVAN